MAYNSGFGRIFMWIFLFIFIGYNLFKWIRELYYENESAKGVINCILFIGGFTVFLRLMRYFSESKTK